MEAQWGKKLMKVLGIDPGTNILGIGIIEECNGIIAFPGKEFRLIKMEILDLRKKEKKKQIERIIFNEISRLIQVEQPNAVAIENQYIGINPKSGLKIASAKNMVILAAQMAAIPYFEYSPSAVKKSACGNGAASKEYVAMFVCSMLGIPKPEFYDITDALAVAICHLNKAKAIEFITPTQ